MRASIAAFEIDDRKQTFSGRISPQVLADYQPGVLVGDAVEPGDMWRQDHIGMPPERMIAWKRFRVGDVKSGAGESAGS